MTKIRIQVALFFFLAISICQIQAQNKSFIENFNDNSLSSNWVTEFARTYQLEESDSILKIAYTRTALSDMWDQFSFVLAGIDASDNPFISIDVKSNIEVELTIKPENNLAGSDWKLFHMLPADSQWHRYVFQLTASAQAPLVKLWIYLNAGSAVLANGQVCFDNLRIGNAAITMADTVALNKAISEASLLIANSKIGNSLGEMSALALEPLQKAVDSAKFVYSNYSDAYSRGLVDSIVNGVYEECMLFESKINYDVYPIIDSSATLQTRYLVQNLKTITNADRFMFGMHDATGYGVGWGNNNKRSDVKDVCGSFPAVFSWDASSAVGGSWADLLDKVTYTYNLGGVQTLCWHEDDPLGRGFYESDVDPNNNYNVVDSILPGGAYHEKYKNTLVTLSTFAKRARDSKGRAIPFIFRPYHEHNGNWFWWGKGNCTESQYKQLWQFTVNYLRDTLGVHNFIYAFSPDGNQYNSKSEYLYGYPGDRYVDILGLDFYFGDANSATVTKLSDRIQNTIEYSKEKNKIPALTETGDRKDWDADDMLEIPNWYTKHLLGAIKKTNVNNRIAYAAVWRNSDVSHHFAPYPGHPAVPDFQDFYGDTATIFLNDLVNLFDTIIDAKDLNSISDAAFFTTFTVDGSIATVMNKFDITIRMPVDTQITALTPEFTTTLFSTVKVNGNEQISGTNTYDFTSPIEYTVFAQNGINSSKYTVKVEFVTSMKDEFIQNSIRVFPNPASEQLNITSATEIRKVELYDIAGSKVKTIMDVNQPHLILDLSSIESGIYYLRVYEDENKSLMKKIIVR